MKTTAIESTIEKTRPVQVLPGDGIVEVAPGERYADLPVDYHPRVGVVRLVPAGDGTYLPRLQVLDDWIRMARAHDYGIPIKRDTLYRLGLAGFIELSQIAPGVILCSVQSVLDHIEECRNLDYWTPSRRRKYLETIGR